MNCPSCGVEMGTLKSDEQNLSHCVECGSIWMDISDLNRLLLQNNLPGLDSLGGKMNLDMLSGQCPECLVDLVEVCSGNPQLALAYASCESCGGILVMDDFSACTNADEASKHLVKFFTAFQNKAKRAPPSTV
ncbi:MAG: zf-TFIIB domain-containing protein [Cystobacterineae bacterium]|nr:zf-TFIIB domain-containing protein [Cystobacterineae bacterium]